MANTLFGKARDTIGFSDTQSLKEARNIVADSRRNRPSFQLIAVEENVGVRLSIDNLCQFPPEIQRILDTRVHSVAFDGTARMGGVAGEQHSLCSIVGAQLAMRVKENGFIRVQQRGTSRK